MAEARLPTRRHLVLAATALLLAGCQTTPPLGSATAIGAIRVEVGRLAAKGQSATAALVKPAMERELASLRTAGGVHGQGVTLVVDVTGLYLTSYAGGAAATLGNDTLESEARLIGADGRLLASYPILAVMAPSFGGGWYRPDVTERRIAALVTSNAQWIKRHLGGWTSFSGGAHGCPVEHGAHRSSLLPLREKVARRAG